MDEDYAGMAPCQASETIGNVIRLSEVELRPGTLGTTDQKFRWLIMFISRYAYIRRETYVAPVSS